MPTLQQYFQALLNLAGNSEVVLIRNSDGTLTLPMPISVAAEYLYNGTRPSYKIMPSEEVAELNDRKWAENEARRLTELARTRANEYNTRSFYTDVVLPALTFGTSSYIPSLQSNNNVNMAYGPATAAALQLGRNPALGKLFWPAALGAGLWTWYANTHEPPAYYSTASNDNQSAAQNQGTTSGSNQSQSTAAPAAPDPDNKKPKRNYGWIKELIPGKGYNKADWRNWRNYTRLGRDITYANWLAPAAGNAVIGINTGKTPIKMPLTSYIPGVFENFNAGSKETEKLKTELDSIKSVLNMLQQNPIQSTERDREQHIELPDSSAIYTGDL